jgi:hypothetical protein
MGEVQGVIFHWHSELPKPGTKGLVKGAFGLSSKEKVGWASAMNEQAASNTKVRIFISPPLIVFWVDLPGCGNIGMNEFGYD